MVLSAAVTLSFAAKAEAQTPQPAEPTEKTEVRDHSNPPMRTIDADIYLNNPSWSERLQRANGPAVTIRFRGTAAPLDRVGKPLPAGAIRMAPEVAGEWKWERKDRLVFSPVTGWLPPGNYHFHPGQGLLAKDCQLQQNTDFGRAQKAPTLTARFRDRNYYVDPATPTLQQLVTTVDFSQPVSLEEARRHFSVTSVTGIEIFKAGSQAQILPEPKSPLRFHLRSPLMQPGEKEDLVLFSFRAGVKAISGGNPTGKALETKLTAYSKYSNFFIKSVSNMLRKTPAGEPEQVILVELSIPAQTAALAKLVQAWKLPPEAKNKHHRIIPWTKDNVTDEVLAKSEKLPLELNTTPGAPPREAAMAFRLLQQPGGKVFIKLPKDTAGPGGFLTAEEFRNITIIPAIPKEASLMGKGGLLALNGERKINVQSRGIDHLRYTVARVQTSQINHLVSQTHGSFESPRFRYGFGFENVSNYKQSVQPIVTKDKYAINYSSFDFSPMLQAAQPGVTPSHGLFYLTVQGVRPRTPEDGVAAQGSPDQDWIPLAPTRSRSYGYRHRRSSARSSANSYPIGDRPLDQRFILVTDLGLIMKEAADGSRVIYVQSFSGRGPVEGVEISVLSKNGTVLTNATTNAIGKAELPSLRGLQREKAPVALVAKKTTT